MTAKKIITVVSPKTNKEFSGSLCHQLPVTIYSVSTVEELFPLLSDSLFHTDFICISIEMFYNRPDELDMFDIINTLTTLIKSTVCRHSGERTKKRNTKIFVIVDETSDVKLVKEIMNFPNIISVGWILKKQADYESTLRHIANLACGNYVHHEKVLELIKPKKKNKETEKVISLTVRQQQVLKIIQERGVSNKIIAKMLKLSESTVKLHIGAILKKYGAKNRTQLALFAKQNSDHVDHDL